MSFNAFKMYSTGEIDYNLKSITLDTSAVLLSSYQIVLADTSLNPITLTLPLASQTKGKTIYIIDVSGTSSTNAINIITQGGNTINGFISILLNSNNSSLSIYSDGTKFNII